MVDGADVLAYVGSTQGVGLGRSRRLLAPVVIAGLGLAGCSTSPHADPQVDEACRELGDANPTEDDDLLAMASAFARETDDLPYGDLVSAANPVHALLTRLETVSAEERPEFVGHLREATDEARAVCRSLESTA